MNQCNKLFSIIYNYKNALKNIHRLIMIRAKDSLKIPVECHTFIGG